MTGKERNGFAAWLIDYLKVLIEAVKGISTNNLTIVASGLVYSTLIALVPCVTFVFAFLSQFGVSDAFIETISSATIDTLGKSVGSEIILYIEKFSSNALSLGVAGLVSFMFTGVFLSNKIYVSINRIFRTRVRGTISRFTTFVIFLLIFCFILASAFIAKNMIISKIISLFGNQEITKSAHLKWILIVIGLWVILVATFKFIPRARIDFRSILTGACTGTIAIVVAYWVFKTVIIGTVKTSVIYGSFASLFFALLFLYICWYIVLFSAEMVYISQFGADSYSSMLGTEPPSEQLSTAVNLFLLISDNYRKGLRPIKLKDMAARLGTPSTLLNVYLSRFVGERLLARINGSKGTYIPKKPLDKIYLRDVINAVYCAGPISGENIETMGEAVAADFLGKGVSGMYNLTIEDLLDRL